MKSNKKTCEYRINGKCNLESSVMYREVCDEQTHNECYHPECDPEVLC